MQNYWNLYLSCKPKQLYGPVDYRDFWETSPRTGAFILYISIWIFDFGPEKLPGLSRNGPLASKINTAFQNQEIMSSLLWLEQQEKGLLKIHFEIAYFSFFLTRSYTPVVPSKTNPTPDQNWQSLYPFPDQNGAKPFPLGWHIPIWLI